MPVDLPERVLRPHRGLVSLNLPELWRYRELFGFLAWRDILVRYKQTYLGVAWAVLQPVLTMVVLTIVFGRFAKLPSDGAPYAILVLSALLPWQFFSNALSESSNSLVASGRMISKVYFPRLIIPASSVLSGVIDALVALAILLVMMPFYKTGFRPQLLLLPVFFSLAFLAAFAAGIWFSALNVKYRDVKYVVPFITRVGMYVTPVGYAWRGVVPEPWQFWFSLNPLVGVIDGFRWCVLGPQFEPYWPGFWASTAVMLVLAITGLLYFRATERSFADVV
ncbi:MAG: ABC transporter permease [Chthoniobacteraceae bacterium]